MNNSIASGLKKYSGQSTSTGSKQYITTPIFILIGWATTISVTGWPSYIGFQEITISLGLLKSSSGGNGSVAAMDSNYNSASAYCVPNMSNLIVKFVKNITFNWYAIGY